jgi:hypothetical protein
MMACAKIFKISKMLVKRGRIGSPAVNVPNSNNLDNDKIRETAYRPAP